MASFSPYSPRTCVGYMLSAIDIERVCMYSFRSEYLTSNATKWERAIKI